MTANCEEYETMLGSMYGYVIMTLFAVVFIGISVIVSKKFPLQGVDDFVSAGRSVPYALVAASVMVSWVWTTTIMGAAEAGTWYGISGGFNYSWGACVPFFIFIPLVVHLRRIMPKTTTFTEFVKMRYGNKISGMFFCFGVGVMLYVFIEQGVGIGIVFNTVFGIPYAVGALIPVLIVAGYVAKAGLRGSIFNDVIQFFIISVIFLVSVPLILKTLGLGNIYSGMLDVVNNPDNINYNPQALSMTSAAGLRYGAVAVVVAMGQVLFDQGYYSKAIATVSTKALLRAYIIGTLLAWAPVPILSGNVFGVSLISLGIGEGAGVDSLSQAAPYIMTMVYGTGIGSVLFVLMIFMAGLTTGGNCLAGAQALFTVDFYKGFVKKNATENEQMRFGRLITLALGVVVGIAAILLEGVSLLKLDIFSGIIFAAPASAFIAGLLWKKTRPEVAVVSVFVGLAAGIGAWTLIRDPDMNWFVGNMLALFLPAVVVIFGSLFGGYEYNFAALKLYEPAHKVNVREEE
jgi:Na+/proline symporter